MPFPHVEEARVTVRPALVVAVQPRLPVGTLLWVLMITNALRTDWPGDVEIPDAVTRGLIVPCKIRTAKIATAVATQARKLGSLDVATMQRVGAEIGPALAILTA